ncbi:MAG TPA: alanine/glycine:cation symporter family protein [Pyrinomonadaceae bacterium]|nr:alanine/glycine:cation symporter family protein [Pyrinomonadaceae bacterium]
MSLPLLSACLLFLIAPALVLAQDSPPPGGPPQPGSAAEAGVSPSPLPITQQRPEAEDQQATGFMAQADRAMGAVNGVIAAFFFFDVIFWDDPAPRKGVRLPLVVLWLVLGAIYFTIKMGFINFRAFGHAIQVVRGKYSNPNDKGEVTHFQALSAALSATVGLGNIAGVAIAVSLGGPGATFWMIIAGLLGMSSKFAECTLGQMYRETRPDGRIMGGAMFYLSKGLAEKGWARLGKVLAVMFAILCIGGSVGGGNSFQVNQSLGALQETVPVLATYPWVYGLIMTVLVGVVIIGGIRRIANVTEKIVPLMCGIYVLGALVIILDNVGRVPAALAAIFTEAFSPDAAYGGLIGAIVVGFQRAAFSNEAGAGSAAIAHSAAKTEYPVREGIVALLEPFIDTVVVCTMTALVIVITGAYNNPAYADLVAGNKGAALTSRAMGEHLTWFPYILSACVFLFAYSTMISWSYYGERCWAWMFGDSTSQIYRIIFLVFVFLGSIITAANILDFGDLMILGMAFPNILGVLILSNKVKAALQDYWAKKEAGEFKAYK